MTKPYFGRLLTAMVTPFHEDGSVNYEAGCQLADWLLDNGTDGLVIEGSTGEAARTAKLHSSSSPSIMRTVPSSWPFSTGASTSFCSSAVYVT